MASTPLEDRLSRIKLAVSGRAAATTRDRAMKAAEALLSSYEFYDSGTHHSEYLSGVVMLENGNVLLDNEMHMQVKEDVPGFWFSACKDEKIVLAPDGISISWLGNFSPFSIGVDLTSPGNLTTLPRAVKSGLYDKKKEGTIYFPRLHIRRDEKCELFYGNAFDGLTLSYASKERIVLRTGTGSLIEIPR